jgi:hypothetical protein
MNKNTSVTMAAGMTVAWILTLAALTMAIQHQAFAQVTGANGGKGQDGTKGGIGGNGGIGTSGSTINGKNGTSANGHSIGGTSRSGD